MEKPKNLTYNSGKLPGLKELIKKVIYFAGRVILFWKRKDIPYNGLKDVKKILFVSLYFRGDVLFHTPVIKLLKELFPGGDVDVWVKPRAAEVLKGNGDVNEILDFDSVKTADYSEDHLTLDLKGKWEFLKKLRAAKYDLIIDYTGLYSTALFTLLSAPRYAAGRNQQGFGFCYNNSIDFDLSYSPGNLIVKYIRMLKEMLMINDAEWRAVVRQVPPQAILYENNAAKEYVRNELERRSYDLNVPLICVHLTAGWEAKRWPLNNFKELIKVLITRYNYQAAVIGGDYDKKEFEKVTSGLENFIPRDKLSNMFFSLPLNYNAELIRMSGVFIGSDSAPLHIAGAVGTPSIGLFGPTNPAFSNPIGEKHLVLYKELSCSAKANEQYCSRNAGKTCGTIDCMKLIEVAEVIEKISLLLKTFPKSALKYP